MGIMFRISFYTREGNLQWTISVVVGDSVRVFPALQTPALSVHQRKVLHSSVSTEYFT